MKDRPEVPEPQPDNPGDPETARESSATVRYGETDRYIFTFVLFTTAGVIVMVLHQMTTHPGSPLDTFRSIILNTGHVAGMGIAFTMAVALVSKTVSVVAGSLRQLPFKSPERKPRR